MFSLDLLTHGFFTFFGHLDNMCVRGRYEAGLCVMYYTNDTIYSFTTECTQNMSYLGQGCEKATLHISMYETSGYIHKL